MKANQNRFLPAIAFCGLLISNVQPATAFDFFARRFGPSHVAAQKCDACQKGVQQKGGCQKGACQKSPHRKWRSPHQKGASQKGAYQKTPHQKSRSPHQKGGMSKGKSGSYGEGFDITPDSGVPLPPPIESAASALPQPVGNGLGERPRSAERIRPRQTF
jgi:hypothetical protein